MNDSASMSSPNQRNQSKVTFNSRTDGKNTQSISINASNNKTNKTILTTKKINNVQNTIKSDEIKSFKYIIYIIISLLTILLVIYICIIFYQNNIISTSHNIFLGLYYNYYQKN